MDIARVLEFLPHRYPMVLIDRVLSFKHGESLVALKNVTYNEPFFPGHFPNKPVMPAVMIIEAMAQATGILGLRSLNIDLDDRSVYYFVGVDNARFRQPVAPGDQLIIEVKLRRTTRGVWKADAVATVDGKRVANAQLMGTLRSVDA
ncbi:MAG: 3-hydroxyacyl-ACP dehydratase FabZ [Gammaproteobacteria bacterium]